MLQEIDTEFEFRQVDLQADRNAKIAKAEAKYQTTWTSLLIPQGGGPNMETLKEMEEKAKAQADKLFRLKEEAVSPPTRKK